MSSLSSTRIRPLALLFSLFVLVGFATGCRAAPESAAASSSMPAASAATGGLSPTDGDTGLLPRSAPAHVTTVTLTLAVGNVADASAKLRDELGRIEGYVSNMTASGEGKDQRTQLTLRVPANRLREFRGSIGRLGEITFEEERVEDVGEERADRKARLTNARAEEKRLLELLAQRTGTLAEVLAAERELSRVRGTIERFEAQAAQLEGKIAFATLTVAVVPSAASKSATAGSRIGKAAADGVRYAGVVMVGLAVGIAEVGPTLLVLGLLLGMCAVAVRFFVRRARRFSAATTAGPAVR